MEVINFLKKNYNFKGKNILITGANGNIGLKLAKFFYNSGANLILTDKTKETKRILNNFRKSKIKHKYIQCDLSISEDKKKLIKFLNNKFSRIDILINNAALTGDQLNYQTKKNISNKDENLIKEIEVNLISCIEIVKGIKKLLFKSKNSCIINISSIYGFTAPKFEIYKNTKLSNPVGYSVSKGGIIQLTKWLASYLAPYVRVNCLSPGGIRRKQSQNFIRLYSKNTLLKKMASDEDVVNGIIFLASNAAKYITGHNLIVDGGWSS